MGNGTAGPAGGGMGSTNVGAGEGDGAAGLPPLRMATAPTTDGSASRTHAAHQVRRSRRG